MQLRSLLVGTMALAGVALIPGPARAGIPLGDCHGVGFIATLGLGGNLHGCFNGTLSELGEDAGLTSTQFYWLGNFAGATGAPNNAPNLLSPGTNMGFTDDCGSDGTPGNFQFCPVDPAHSTGLLFNQSGELVLGLNVPDPNSTGPGSGPAFYWIYSGDDARNAFPQPTGFQAVLLQLTKVDPITHVTSDDQGQFLFAWEDLNSGCTHEAGDETRFREQDLTDPTVLDSRFHNCDAFNTPPDGNSDSDFNDSYIRFSIQGIQLQNPVPEPMTMSLMAFGLVGLGAASFRRRKNK
jgi:hypothetical protein